MEQVPWDLTNAIQRATQILWWQDNLQEKWMPPEWMWPLDEELVEHFEWVKEQRQNDAPGAYDNDDEEDQRPSDRRRARVALAQNDYSNS